MSGKIFNNTDLGKKLNFNYLNSRPYPNIILDQFIDNSVAHQCFFELKNYSDWNSDVHNPYVEDHQINKFFTPWSPESLEQIKISAPTVYQTLQYFNSTSFLKFLEDLTGIKNIIPDPNFHGGGCHKVGTGGKLSLHVDYNLNRSNQYRILNFLLYLNPVWEEEWEGALELWDTKTKECCHKIFPLFNRGVIFTLSDNSVHGHPTPLKCPEHIQRYSLALYYFVENPEQEISERTSVVWYEA